jgi:ribonuclease T2
MDPSISRSLAWNADSGEPITDPIPNLPGETIPESMMQPLFGFGASLKPLYVLSPIERNQSCLYSSSSLPPTEFCSLATRNMPQRGWKPAFIAFPTNSSQVALAVQFAATHRLRICIAATGHDLLNRHSCDDNSLMIRTGLMKKNTWNLTATSDAPYGSATFQTGVTWEEVAYAASANSRIIVSGWCGSVGIAGWHLGSGYGPLTRLLGLGGDQPLQFKIVLANGTLVKVNKAGNTHLFVNGSQAFYPAKPGVGNELFWALRGGGGSTFGILTELTVKAHPLPEGGITYAGFGYDGDACSKETFDFHHELIKWIASLSNKWSGLYTFTPSQNSDPTGCPVSISFNAQWVYAGSQNDTKFQSSVATIAAAGAEPRFLASANDMYSLVLGALKANPSYINVYPNPIVVGSDQTLGGVPSVLISREKALNGDYEEVFLSIINLCNRSLCTGWASGVAFPDPQASDRWAATSPSLRGSLFHFQNLFPQVGTYFESTLYSLGPHSYFGESAYTLTEWPTRYWNRQQYLRLLLVKKSVDPKGVFTCHHCVGDWYNGSDKFLKSQNFKDSPGTPK